MATCARPTPGFLLTLGAAALGPILLLACGGQKEKAPTGGTRLVYLLPIEEARDRGILDPRFSPRQVVDRAIRVLKRRLDPEEKGHTSVKPLPANRIEVVIPGTTPAEVAAARSRIEQLGRLEWILVVDASQDEYDLGAERGRLAAWLEKPANQAAIGRDPLAIQLFNNLPPQQGGPVAGKAIRWVPMHKDADLISYLEFTRSIEWTDPAGRKQTTKTRFIPVNTVEDSFSGEDLDGGSIQVTHDNLGTPAVAFELRRSRCSAFGAFTEKHKKRPFAIVLNGYCRTAPTIASRIPGRGIITLGSGTKAAEVLDLVLVLHTGGLDIRPRLVSEHSLAPEKE